MCRHLAYLGPPTDLASLLIEPPRGLLRQSWAPREMRGGGTINADGFGVGWYPATGAPPAPVRYRRSVPMWSDTGFAELARVVRSGALLAAVRSATVGMPAGEAACAPFAAGDWLFSHNGVVTGWPESVAGLAARLPVTDLLTLEAPTDSALLWALVRHRLRADPGAVPAVGADPGAVPAVGADPGAVLAATVAEVTAVAPGSRLNLLLTDGRRVYATTAGHSLAVHHTPGRLVVASEPYDDDPGWRTVPDRRVVTGDPTTYTLEEL